MITSIFTIHIFLSKIGALVLKIDAIHGKQFGENASFNLFNKLIRTITINKCTFSGSVGMQV
jgi:hypothetical protein